MRRAEASAGTKAIAARRGAPPAIDRLTIHSSGVLDVVRVFVSVAAAALALAAALPVRAANAPADKAAPASTARMTPLADDELSAVRGADGIAFNLSNFSLTSLASNPLSLTYATPGGSSLTLSGLDLSRTDDADGFADPYSLTMVGRPGLSDVIAIDFPLNVAGNQKWALTADFTNVDAAAGTTFFGGTLQVTDLTMKGGGLTIAPSALAGTQGIAFGLGTQLDIGSLAIYSRGRDAALTLDASDALVISGIHLADAATGGAWMLADVTKHPGLINAVTDASGSYLHLQIGWPTTADPVPAASLKIDNIAFSTINAGAVSPTTANLGSASIASMQINYVDIKFRSGP